MRSRHRRKEWTGVDRGSDWRPPGPIAVHVSGHTANATSIETTADRRYLGIANAAVSGDSDHAIVGKLRAALRTVGVPRPHGVASDVGTYQLVVPSAWIDIEEARTAIDRAEGALRGNALSNAWAAANVAAAIARQPFLPDEERLWVQQQRAQLLRVWRRALLVLSAVSLRNGEHELGIQHAADVLAAEPFDEMACQALMRAHAVAGNRAEALRVFANCRKLFRDELGAEPSEQTAAVFLSILRAE